ncbi:MAG TPA: hypothetical protein VFO60_07390 [Candidatus Dormibacteraeota bacterium]|nr:hypothetical protein [Candidatus Dormibacteraeota bacterium]
MTPEAVTVQVLWDVLLVVVVAVVVPIVLYRAAHLVRAVRNIDILFSTTLTAAAGVVRNTEPTSPALDATIATASGILGTAGRIDEHSAAIEALLRERAGGERR